ncbi:hypothetical protein D3C87_1579920 [compost metagenome]
MISGGQALIFWAYVEFLERDLFAEWVLRPAEFRDVVVGDFLQVLAVCMNWCGVGCMGSLSLSLPMRWQGVGTLGYPPRTGAVV